MSISKKQLQDTAEIIKKYTNDEISDSEVRLRTLIQSLYNVIVNDEDNTIHAIDESHGLQDTPIGVILPYMGKNPPRHYLVCDGTEYNIADYPILANHFLTEFEEYNYFGGDGITTFAVPDLRGEFLRGTGQADGRKFKGSDVGKHQEPTYTRPVHINSWMQNGKMVSGIYYFHESASGDINDPAIYNQDHHKYAKRDTMIVSSTIELPETNPYIPNCIATAAFRPTNTAVTYIIKYEPTFYIQCNPKMVFSTDETRIGTDIDGSSVYQIVFPNITVCRPDDGYGNTCIQIPDLNIKKVISLNVIMNQSSDKTLINNSFIYDGDTDCTYSCSTSISPESNLLVFTFGKGSSNPNNKWAYNWFPITATVYLIYTKKS